MTGYNYIILGAGKQGVAAAYDVLKFGNAAKLTILDGDASLAKKAAARLQKLAGAEIKQNKIKILTGSVNGRDKNALKHVIKGHHAVLSALPYYLNPSIAEAAIAVGANYCDLGGYFETTQQIMKLGPKAKKAGVSLITDCGVSPGMCNSLAVCGMDILTTTKEVHMYCGGLPQNPRPPLDYKIVFNLEGLIGNYFGKAYVLQNGKVGLIPSFSGRESLTFEKLGKLEAVVTGGATSTCPWSFQGKVDQYDYKTLRYPGHFDKIQTLKDLGLFETDPVKVKGCDVAPRDLFVAAAGPRLAFPDDRDLTVMRVVVRGDKDGHPMEVVYDMLDYYDDVTGFTAMQRTTGFSAAIVLEQLARGRVTMKGDAPLEKSIPGRFFLDEIRKRGVNIKETIRPA